MNQQVGSVQSVAEVFEGIAHSSAQQSTGIVHVNESIIELEQMTHQNAALVEESAAAAASLSEQAINLTKIVGAFRLGVRAVRG